MTKSKTITSKSTIMFTDIVGYSQMVAKDEKRALELLDEHNNIIYSATFYIFNLGLS